MISRSTRREISFFPRWKERLGKASGVWRWGGSVALGKRGGPKSISISVQHYPYRFTVSLVIANVGPTAAPASSAAAWYRL